MQMASRKTLLVAAAMAVVATATLLPATASKTFTVRDAAGWGLGVNYVAWAEGKKFRVNDTLVFEYDNPKLDVVLVDEESFGNCSTSNNSVVLSSGRSLAARIVFPGRYFFICDAKGACKSGMKLAINAVR